MTKTHRNSEMNLREAASAPKKLVIYIYMHVHACETTYMPLITVNVNCYQFKIGEENRANSI